MPLISLICRQVCRYNTQATDNRATVVLALPGFRVNIICLEVTASDLIYPLRIFCNFPRQFLIYFYSYLIIKHRQFPPYFFLRLYYTKSDVQKIAHRKFCFLHNFSTHSKNQFLHTNSSSSSNCGT